MNKNLLLLVLVSIAFTVNAQDKKTETKTAPVEVAPAPAPKKKVSTTNTNGNPWEIGISGGLNYVWGDVSSRVKLDFNNSTFGLHLRKALTNSFSWRWQYNYGTATMADFRPHNTAIANGVSTTFGQNTWFVSSQMYSHSLAWDQVLTVGNSGMKRMNQKWTMDLFAGPAIFLYRTRLDLSNANGSYNPTLWNTLENTYNANLGTNILSGDQRAKRVVSEAMDAAMDGVYESPAANNGGKSTLGGYAVVPAATFGASVNRKISNRFSASLEHRMFYVFDDYLDGERFANFSTTPSYSQMNDMVHQTTVKINYNLGKGTAAPLYWRNPNEELQKKLAEMNPRKEINAAFADEDGDGVPNILDQEPASREGCPVDTKGVMLDSDKDGLIDCDDKEPYSPAGYPVDNQGVAKVPPPACCADITKAAATQVKQTQVKPSGDCAEVTLPSVTFEKDKFGLNSNSAVALQSIGEKMQKCPDMKLVVNGINDRNNKNGKYNEQLSYNRAMEVATYLEERFGVSRDRFIVRYNLEGTGDADADRAVMFRNAQEGETGASNPPSPHPGLKAGKK